MRSEPGEFFPPDRGGIFQLSDISRELSFGFPFSFAGKEKGKRGHGPLRVKITGRMHRPCIPTVRTVSRGVQTVFSGSRIGVRDDTVRIEDGMTGDRIEGGMTKGVTPHVMRGPEK